MVFTYAMLLFPEVQARVAAEMDEIVGPDRMPTLADLPNLPFLQAAWTESLRWRPPVPLCESNFAVYRISSWLGGPKLPH